MTRIRGYLLIPFMLLSLIACGSPQPTAAPIVSTPISPQASDATLISAWQVWRVVMQPEAVHAVAVDGDRLWLGTSFGVLRYDPRTETFDNFQEIGITTRLLLTNDGGLWAASDTGLYYFDGQHWIKATFSKDFQPYADRVYQLGIDQNGDLFVAAGVSRGVRSAHFNGHVPPSDHEWAELINVTPAAPYPFGCSGWQAMATINRAYRSPEECEKQTAAEEAIKPFTFEYPNIVIDGDGSVWWAAGSTFNHLVNGSSTAFPLPTGSIYAMAADSKHGVWLGTDRGLAYYNERQTKWYSPHIDRPIFRDTPIDIAIDTRGTAYVPTQNTGELYTLPVGQKQWIVTDVAQSRSIVSLAAASDDGLWATHGWDLVKIGGTPITPLKVPDKNCGLSQITVDSVGNVWSTALSCSRVLQYNLNLNGWIQYQLLTAQLDGLHALTIGTDDTPYLLSTSGVYSHTAMLNGNLDLPLTDWQPITSINQSLGQAATMPDGLIAADRKGGLWIASITTGEVWNYTGDHITPFGQHIQPNTLTNLYVDAADRSWLIGQDTLVMFDGRTWRDISAPDIGYVSRITSSPDERIWLIGQRGIAVYDPTRDATP